MYIYTQCHVCVIYVIERKVRCWASPALESYALDPSIKSMMHNLLLPPISKGEKQEQLAYYLTGNYERPQENVESSEESVSDEDLEDTPQYIENSTERTQCFKALFTKILIDVERISITKMTPKMTVHFFSF